LFENFPKGTGFPVLQALVVTNDLPLAAVLRRFPSTIQPPPRSTTVCAAWAPASSRWHPHRRAGPGGAAWQPDRRGRSRPPSTGLHAGYKLTMLPDALVQHYTLQEGRNCPALSLYDDEATLITATATRLEQVPIAANLRHDVLDSTFTEAFF
jgi:exoribonuclease-2